MSYCTKCGAPLEPGCSFCPGCGVRLKAGASGGEGGSKPPRRSRAPLWITLGVLVVALAVAAAIILPKLSTSKDKPAKTGASEANLQPVYAAAAPYENEDGTVPEDKAQDAIDAVYEAALRNPDVLSCEKDEYGVFMEVAEGPDYVYCPAIEGVDAGGGDLEIITLQPYDTENREKAALNHWIHDLDAPDDVGRALEVKDARWEFDADVNDDAVNMDRILSLSNYQVILWQGHGGYTESAGYYLCTNVLWSEDLAARYGLDKSNCYRYSNTEKIGLRPEFFRQSFPNGAFDNAFIYLATCHSGREETMARTLLDKGAAVVFVNSDTIDRGYNLDMLHLIAESYLVGPDGETTQAAMQYLGKGYSYNTPENWSIGDSLALAQLRYGEEDPHRSFTARVYYLCRPGMEHTPYSKWIEGFKSAAAPGEPREGLSELRLRPGETVYADIDFDGRKDTVSVSGMSRLRFRLDFGSGESFETEMSVDADGSTPDVKLLSFTDGDYICYAFTASNPGSKYNYLSWNLFGQDYLAGGSLVPLSTDAFPSLDAWGGVYDGRWVVVVRSLSGAIDRVYGIPDSLYGDLQRMAVDYGRPVLPVPYSDGVDFEIYALARGDGKGYRLAISQSCSSEMGYLECPGLLCAAYEMRSPSQAVMTEEWFEPDSYYLYPLSGVTPSMVDKDLLAAMPGHTDAVADGKYWAVFYAVKDQYGSRVSPEIDLEDYMYFSQEEIAALRIGDTLELSRFVPIDMNISLHIYSQIASGPFGYFSTDYDDVTVTSMEYVHDDWMGELLYINRQNGNWDYKILQDYNGRWRLVTDEDYVPMQFVRTVTLPLASNVHITDQLTPAMNGAENPGTQFEWDDPNDFFAFNTDMYYFEAQITVKNGVITEIFIPYRP